MREGEEDTDAHRAFHRIPEPLLKEPSEIRLFRERDPDELKKGGTLGKKEKRLACI